MQDDTLLTVCTKNFSLKIMLFYNSRWIQNFSKQKQNDTLLTAYTKIFLIKLSGFTTHGGYKIFLSKCSPILYSRCALKSFTFKIILFYYSRWIQKFSIQRQNNTLLRMSTKKLLLKLCCFTTHGGYKISLNKSRTILYSRCTPKNF